jgi:hypothetical protein
MKSLNPNLHPKRGFTFTDSDGAKINGDTWAGVIQRVINYRKRANLPPGDPTSEVINQACAHEPVLCVEQDPRNLFALKKASLKSRVLAWLAGMRAKKATNEVTYGNEQDARNRVNVCITCPHNQAIPEGCASCKAAIKAARDEVIPHRFQDGRLHACMVLGEDLATSVHLEQVTVENGELPPHCWRKRVL